jgi:bifunctional enzyme CysN/CysC
MHTSIAQAGWREVGDRDQLHIVACGSVDDGKSTLIGRLLIETGSVTDDQLEKLSELSRRYGGVPGELEYALLLDGLEAERQQGITIDVAYRYFATAQRAFVVADTPGHEQYTRNMLTGASTADLALLLVDVRHGITTQTKRHARIAALLGIRHVLLVVNKMDLADHAEPAFIAVRDAFGRFAEPLGFAAIEAIPVAARHGDNVAQPSARMPWHRGATVLGHLESTEVASVRPQALRYLVQSVTRANGDFRGLAGVVASGDIARGETLTVSGTGRTVRVDRIVTLDGDLERAAAGEAITLVLADHADVARGDMLARPGASPELTDQFAAHLVWLDEHPLLPSRTYLMRIGTRMVPASITALRHRIDIETGGKIAGRTLAVNDIGVCNLSTATPVALDSYSENRATGAFILIDRDSAATVGAGMVDFSLHRASNVRQQSFVVDKAARARQKSQRPCILWLTGLPGAGKSTIMNLVEQQLARRGVHTYALDGDNLRRGLNHDLGFTDEDRVENIRRAGEVARLMVDAGLVVLCAFISPFRADRRMVRELVEASEFLEVFVDTPLAECMARDPKGLYAKAQAGRVRHVTGLDSPYEPPEAPELHLVTVGTIPEKMADQVIEELERRGVIGR